MKPPPDGYHTRATLADADSLPPGGPAWRSFANLTPEEQARGSARWMPARAGLQGHHTEPVGCPHAPAVRVTESDGTEWCPLCGDDLEAFAGVVVRWVREHQDECCTTWDVALGLSPPDRPTGAGGVTRPALGSVLRWLERDGQVARDGYAPATWPDGRQAQVIVWRAR